MCLSLITCNWKQRAGRQIGQMMGKVTEHRSLSCALKHAHSGITFTGNSQSWIHNEVSVVRNCNPCGWSRCLHAICCRHLHSCYCIVTSLSLSGPFNCWRNEIRPDNNPANAIRQCFIRAPIPLEAQEAFLISAGGKKVQQKLNPCWRETIRASGCEVELASKPLTHLHQIVTTK